MLTAVIWGYILVATIPAAPEQEPHVLFDYPTEQLCLDDKLKLEESVQGYKAFCIPVPKPEAKQRVAKKRTVKKPVSSSRRRIVRR